MLSDGFHNYAFYPGNIKVQVPPVPDSYINAVKQYLTMPGVPGMFGNHVLFRDKLLLYKANLLNNGDDVRNLQVTFNTSNINTNVSEIKEVFFTSMKTELTSKISTISTVAVRIQIETCINGLVNNSTIREQLEAFKTTVTTISTVTVDLADKGLLTVLIAHLVILIDALKSSTSNNLTNFIVAAMPGPRYHPSYFGMMQPNMRKYPPNMGILPPYSPISFFNDTTNTNIKDMSKKSFSTKTVVSLYKFLTDDIYDV